MDPISTAFALAQFVPGILKWITGSDQAEQAASTVIDIAKQVTGKDSGQAALSAIQTDPAALLAFRQAVIAAEVDLDKAFLADRQDARKRDVQLAQLGRTTKRADLMIVGDVIGMLACLSAMVFVTWLGVTKGGDVNPLIMALNGPLGMLTQQFANGLRDAHQFEFGSSRGSAEKTELLARAPAVK